MKNEAQKQKKEIPSFVSNFGSEEPKKPTNFTPDDLKNDDKLSQKLPKPTGYRMLILPFAPAEKTKGGLFLDATQELVSKLMEETCAF